MIQNMRDKSGSWLTGVITVVIILTFALWGIQRLFVSGSSNTPVAKVNGVKISQQQLYVAWQQLQHEKQTQLGAKFYDDPTLPAQLKQQALKLLVERTILTHHLDKLGCHVSRVSTSEAIFQMPTFQVDGKFSSARFVQVITAQGYNQSDFFNLMNQLLMMQQLFFGISLSQFLSVPQAVPLLAHFWQKRQFSSVILTPTQFTNQVKVSQADIKQYYQTHAQQFLTPEQVQISYIQLSPAMVRQTIQPDETALKQFYQQHRQQFGKDSRYDKVADQVRSAYITEQTNKQFAQKRDDLANLIYEHPDSLQPTAAALKLALKTTAFFDRNGGKLGVIKDRAVITAAFSDAVLKQSESSDVITLADGSVVVLHLQSHKVAKEKPLAVVQSQIVKQLTEQKATVLARETAEKLVGAIHSGQSLQQVSQQYHVTWKSQGFVTYDDKKVSPQLLQQIFLLPQPAQKKLSAASVALPDGTYGVVVLQSVAKTKLTLTLEQKKLYVKRIAQAKGQSLLQLYKQTLLKQAKIHYYKSAIESVR
ncbi:MAG: hypothetical protein GY782_03695 [Gammaproteobacteria bacterium]|nr:hypothetical protein [Gammaproteobacteria bacterium]